MYFFWIKLSIHVVQMNFILGALTWWKSHIIFNSYLFNVCLQYEDNIWPPSGNMWIFKVKPFLKCWGQRVKFSSSVTSTTWSNITLETHWILLLFTKFNYRNLCCSIGAVKVGKTGNGILCAIWLNIKRKFNVHWMIVNEDNTM